MKVGESIMASKKEHSQEKALKEKKHAMPDVFVIIFIFLVLAFLTTYILPSGTFERIEEDGITQVVPDSFQYINAESVSFLEIFSSIPRGLIDSAGIVFLILIVGGVVAVIESTGTIDTGIHSLIRKSNGNYNVLIATFCTIFAVISSLGITVNGVIAFVPIGLIIARSLKLDPVVAVAMVFLGAYSGWAAGVFDPTVTILGQQIAELPLFSGYLFRIGIFVVFVAITILYICSYAKRIRKNPEKSLMGINPFAQLPVEEENQQGQKFTIQHTIIILLFFSTVGLYLFGAFNFGWGINELSAIFILLGVVVAFIGRISPNAFVDRFMKGAIRVIYGALVVGMARAVIIILEDGQIIDTIVHSVSSSLDGFSPVVSMQLLYVFNFIFNGIITSGTGQAAIVMPLMVPIGDMLEVTRQSTFITFKLGDAVTNIITPLSGTLMACLAIAKVSFGKWVKFAFPLTIIWIVTGAIFVAIAVLINYGPY